MSLLLRGPSLSKSSLPKRRMSGSLLMQSCLHQPVHYVHDCYTLQYTFIISQDTTGWFELKPNILNEAQGMTLPDSILCKKNTTGKK